MHVHHGGDNHSVGCCAVIELDITDGFLILVVVFGMVIDDDVSFVLDDFE